jgi:hypothetical protein
MRLDHKQIPRIHEAVVRLAMRLRKMLKSSIRDIA